MQSKDFGDSTTLFATWLLYSTKSTVSSQNRKIRHIVVIENLLLVTNLLHYSDWAGLDYYGLPGLE